MTLRIKKVSAFAVSLTLIAGSVAIAYALINGVPQVKASAVSGLQTFVASTSLISVGPQNNVWSGYGTTTREPNYACASRIVSTVGQPVMISFSSVSSTSLSQTAGFLQAASTSIVYDSGLYGCGYMTIRGLNASTTITEAETR